MESAKGKKENGKENKVITTTGARGQRVGVGKIGNRPI